MDLQKYIKDATRTESHIKAINTDPVITARVFAGFVAAGTLLDMIKKSVFYRKPIDATRWNQAVNELNQIGMLLNTDDLGVTDIVVKQKTSEVDPRIFHGVVGIATEATELIEAIQSGGPVDAVNIQEEIGDICWYVAILLDTIGGNWEQLLNTNIAKLRARYPEKFTNEDAIERDLVTERQILEGKVADPLDINFIEVE